MTIPLSSFEGATIIPKGTVELSMTLGSKGTIEISVILDIYPTSVVILTKKFGCQNPMTYNAIYGRPLLNAVGVVPSTYY